MQGLSIPAEGILDFFYSHQIYSPPFLRQEIDIDWTSGYILVDFEGFCDALTNDQHAMILIIYTWRGQVHFPAKFYAEAPEVNPLIPVYRDGDLIYCKYSREQVLVQGLSQARQT